MKISIKKFSIIFVCILTVFFASIIKAQASYTQLIPSEFDYYAEGDLNWSSYDDEGNTASTPIGFSATIGGATYDRFDMNSNGYVQLLSGSQTETNYGYGSLSALITDDPSSTYLLAAYDDLDSQYYGYYGYKLFSDKAVFYYDTETYYDGDSELLNNFEMILSQNGTVQWNFNYADYYGYDYDLFSGLYFGNTGTQLGLYSGYIPTEESWLYNEDSASMVPEPASILLFSLGLAPLALRRKKAA